MVFTSVSNVAPRRLQGGIVPGGAIISALNDVEEAIDHNALGTQVGSEGVKAPTKADDEMKDNVKAVVVLIGANDYGYTEGNGQPGGRPTRL